MQRALMLAKKGAAAVRPNPMVGCVIVAESAILAEGWHEKFGGPHAEVNAISQLPAEVNLSTATVFVTLEPCSHFGKTPPCVDLLISKRPARVVVAMKDPNPLVAGRGIERLRSAGINVEVGLCHAAARELNKYFVTYHELQRPYITLKWAMTADGFISQLPLPESKGDNRISCLESLRQTHQLRAEHMAILVGRPTVEADDPLLTTRLVDGPNPLPLIIDRYKQLTQRYRLTSGAIPAVVYNEEISETKGATAWVKLMKDQDFLDQVMADLHQRKIHSLLVEGGAQLLEKMITSGKWDEMVVFVNPGLKFGKGVAAPKVQLPERGEISGSDYLFRIKNNTAVA